MNQLYDLKGYKPGRRAGLTVAGYKGPRLLQIVNHPTTPKINPDDMPPKTYTRSNPTKKVSIISNANDSAKENIEAPPESSSDETSDQENAADIKPQEFRKTSRAKPGVQNGGAAGGGVKSKPTTVHGNKPSRIRDVKVDASSNSSNTSSPKRKSGAQDDQWRGKGANFGRNMVDAFGRVQTKKLKTYGSSQSRQTSSQSAQASKMNADISPVSPQSSNNFVIPDLFNSPIKSQGTEYSPQKPAFWKPDDLEKSPQQPRTPAEKFAVPDELEHTPISTPEVEKRFRNPGELESQAISDAKDGESFTDLDKSAETSTSSPPSNQKLFQRPTNAFPRRDPKKLLELRKDDLGGDVASRVQDIFGQDGDNFGVDSMELFDNEFNTSTKAVARCPMCNQPCDAAELKKWGAMDTRKQERFCRSHRKTTAEKKWSSKGYPEIDWEKLDSRISEHHDFIKGLLNGADCHYRRTFEKMVAAGKGRSLRKLESNLTPGYYGSRGLNTISEYVIREFSRLLSKRSVKDPLMSKRGTTAFVQSVIVPEVAVRLIIEDMSIEDVEARDVLTESANMGELVNEEIRDVVEERIENSEDDDED